MTAAASATRLVIMSTALCWPGTAAIFRQPSILCNVITSLTKGR